MRRVLGAGLAAVTSLVLASAVSTTATAQPARGFTAHLTGDQEVPPVDTDALGQAVVRVNPSGVSHVLTVARIDKVVAAHIHCAPEGVNGPVGVTLFAGAPVSRSGVLSRGAILDVDSGNACGWADLDDMIAAIESGDTYVNVHTLDHLPGEIRGQLR